MKGGKTCDSPSVAWKKTLQVRVIGSGHIWGISLAPLGGSDVLAMRCEEKRGKYDFKCYVLSSRKHSITIN